MNETETHFMKIGTRRALRRTAIVAAIAAMTAPAWAGSAKIGDDITVDYALTATYSLASRVSDQSQALINGPRGSTGLPSTANSDDGDRNFKKGSLIANRVSLLGEADIKRQNLGFFVRASGFYDGAYQGRNDNDSPSTVNKSGAFNEFTSDARHFMGERARFLDAYAYGTFDLGETSRLNVRLGQQVVQWGEGLFFPNIAGAQGPVDATKANVPGIEVKDILLPVGQVAGSLRINSAVSLLGYVQYQYKPNELNPVGSYFSTSDVVGPGAEFIRVAPGFNIYRGADIEPGNSGQWGLGTRLRLTDNTEAGLYYLRYHDKNPSVVTSYASIPVAPHVLPTGYNIKFLDDIKLTGMSLATKLGDVSLGGELSYKQDVPVLVNSLLGAVSTRADAVQGQVNMIYTMGPTFLADSTTFAGELGYLQVGKVQPTLVLGVPASQLSATKSASAGTLTVAFNYNNVFDGWDLVVPVSYAQAFKGRAAVPGAFGSLYGQGDKRLSVGLTFKYLNNLELGISYSAYLGSADLTLRPLADRDYVAFNAKYSF
jgi:hypothetical protein